MEIALALIEIFKDTIAAFAGVFIVWVILAAFTGQIQEWISQLFKWRSTMLENSIRDILADDDLADKFYNHPFIQNLHGNKGTRKPSYIPSRHFASVIFHMIIYSGAEESFGMDMRKAIINFRKNVLAIRKDPEHDLSKLASTLDIILIDVSVDLDNTDNVDKAEKSLAEIRNRIEVWYNDAMQTLSRDYRRKTQLWLIAIGIVLAATLNADSLAIANALWQEPLPSATVGQNSEDVRNLPIPLGWTSENLPQSANELFLKIGGILFSGLVAASGAPYLFDVMRKSINKVPPIEYKIYLEPKDGK